MFTWLSVVQPPTEEPVTVELAKRHARIDTSVDDDDLIPMYITAARDLAEQYLSRVLVQQQLLWVMAQTQPRGAWPYSPLPFSVAIMPLWFPWPYMSGAYLDIPRPPLISVDQVAIGQWGKPDTILNQANGDYQSDLFSNRVMINPPAFTVPNDHVAVTFTAGYGSDASFVPAPIRIAVLMLFAYIYEHRGDQPTDMPLAIERLLSPFRLVTMGSG